MDFNLHFENIGLIDDDLSLKVIEEGVVHE